MLTKVADDFSIVLPEEVRAAVGRSGYVDVVAERGRIVMTPLEPSGAALETSPASTWTEILARVRALGISTPAESADMIRADRDDPRR